MSKTLLHSTDARAAILKGVNVVANAVKVTLGPRGRNAVIDEHPMMPPLITKDGVTVARSITHLADPFENMGAKMVKAVASQTGDANGDGTTTATILAQAIYAEGLDHLAAGANPVALKRGIDKAVEVVSVRLKELAIPVTDSETIARVGTISANGDRQIGDLIAQAMEKVGLDGVITLGESTGAETTLEVTEGMEIDRGLALNIFLTNVQRYLAELDFPYILITERRFQKPSDSLMRLIEEVAKRERPLVIVAEEFEAQGLVFLANNIANGALRSLGIKCPEFGDERREILRDLAAVTGAYAFTNDCGRKIDSATIDDLGKAERVVSGKDRTTFTGGFGDKDKIKSRIDLLRTLADTEENDFKKAKYKHRLARLASGIAVIKVGGQSETEMKEKKARVEDAVHATKAAREEGIVPGGGVALLQADQDVGDLIATLKGDERKGAEIIGKVLSIPLRTICENAGLNAQQIWAQVSGHPLGWGYNAATDVFEDLVAAGVIDPVRVVRVALQNAASVASMMLTTECMISEAPAKPTA